MKLLRLFPLLFLVATPCFGSDIAIITTTVPNGTLSTSYAASIQASGSCTPYVWTIRYGSLPTGISAKPSSNSTSLYLTGTPIHPYTYSFTEEVKGCDGHSVTQYYKIVIQKTAQHVVDVKWKASTSKDVAGYNLYRAPDGVNWKKINSSLIASTLYTDSTVANGSTYYYEATAVDIYDNESVRSSPIKVAVP
jgi:hypothetical protein